MIFWGPPGVGKTTLARLMADAFDADFIALSAVFSGVKDIREAISRPRRPRAGAAHHPLRRRGASLQQGAAGCLPAVSSNPGW
jgi:stage III sporulation protein SpoIIIAA